MAEQPAADASGNDDADRAAQAECAEDRTPLSEGRFLTEQRLGRAGG